MKNSPWERLERGETLRGLWPLGLPEWPPLPILAAQGTKPGPTLLVTGGVHGDEYEGPAAIHALFDRLDATRLAGRVIGLPVVNVPAWEARSRNTPADGVNLNRAFGVEHGTNRADSPSYALAEAVFDRFVRRCDVLIDLHSGGAALMHLPMIGWYAGGSGEAEGIARRFGAALHPWVIPDVPGVLSCEAHRIGKVALGAEWQGGGRLDPDGMSAYAEGLRRVLLNLEMIPPEASGQNPPPDPRPPIAGGSQRTSAGGLFQPCVGLGEGVVAGTKIGVLYDLLGTAVAEVEAERSGLVAGLAHRALLHPGDIVAYIG